RAPWVLRSRLSAQPAGDRGHQRAQSPDRAGRDGHPQAGAVGRPIRWPAGGRRGVDRRLAVRLRVGSQAARPEMVGGQWSRMDLQTRDRASPDVAALPAREPGVPEAGGDRGQAPGRLSRATRLLDPRAQRGAAVWVLIALAAAAVLFDYNPRLDLVS